MNTSSISTSETSTNGINGHVIKKHARIYAPVAESKPTYNLEQDSVWCACNWYEARAKENYFPHKKANSGTSATKSLVGNVMDPANPHHVLDTGDLITIAWVKANLGPRGVIFTKFMNGRDGEKRTFDTYVNRMMHVLDGYEARCKNPDTFSLTDYFADSNKFHGASEGEEPSMKTQRRKPRETAPVATPVPLNIIQIPLDAQHSLGVVVPEGVVLTAGHIEMVASFLARLLPAPMTRDDLLDVIAALGPRSEGWDKRKGIDQLTQA